MESTTLEGAHARWASILQEYDFQIVHRPGVQHANADTLLRLPLPTTRDNTGARLDEDPPVVMTVSQARDILSHTGGGIHPLTEVRSVFNASGHCVTILDTRPRPEAFRTAFQTGVILYEPFGGMAAGLEALLASVCSSYNICIATKVSQHAA